MFFICLFLLSFSSNFPVTSSLFFLGFLLKAELPPVWGTASFQVAGRIWAWGHFPFSESLSPMSTACNPHRHVNGMKGWTGVFWAGQGMKFSIQKKQAQALAGERGRQTPKSLQSLERVGTLSGERQMSGNKFYASLDFQQLRCSLLCWYQARIRECRPLTLDSLGSLVSQETLESFKLKDLEMTVDFDSYQMPGHNITSSLESTAAKPHLPIARILLTPVWPCSS